MSVNETFLFMGIITYILIAMTVIAFELTWSICEHFRSAEHFPATKAALVILGVMIIWPISYLGWILYKIRKQSK